MSRCSLRVDSRHIQQKLGQHGPQILHVPEEHIQRGKQQAHAEVEHQQHDDRIDKREKLPCEHDPVQRAEQEEHTQCNGKVDERLRIFDRRNRYFGTLTLVKIGALLISAISPSELDSAKKLKTTVPQKRYVVKCGIALPKK